MKIYILEYFDFSATQLESLKKIGDVVYYKNGATPQQIERALNLADVILLDWIDANKIVPKMKKGQMLCLPYKGFNWTTNLKQALDKGVVVCESPVSTTNAVAEHNLTLILSACKRLTQSNHEFKSGKGLELFDRNFELDGKTVGIVLPREQERRLIELLQPFGVEILTFGATDEGFNEVPLTNLLKKSDVVCVCGKDNKNLIATENLNLLKHNSILICSSKGVINLKDLARFMRKDKLFGVALSDFDFEEIPEELLNNDKVICTFRSAAFDTTETEKCRIDTCIENIRAFKKGKPINTIVF